MALKLAALGASVALLARTAQSLEDAVRIVESEGGRAIGIRADVADVASMREAVSRVESEFGGLDVLVNNAGIGIHGPVEHLPVESWRKVIETNLTGVFIATQAALPAIRRRGAGHIVAVSSGAGKRGYPNMAAYCASKFGLQGLMESLAAELEAEPIKCHTIVPGGILTDFGMRTRDDRVRSGDRFLEPQDVADAIAFVLTRPARVWTQELSIWPR